MDAREADRPQRLQDSKRLLSLENRKCAAYISPRLKSVVACWDKKSKKCIFAQIFYIAVLWRWKNACFLGDWRKSSSEINCELWKSFLCFVNNLPLFHRENQL
jgi:hypothetical protein